MLAAHLALVGLTAAVPAEQVPAPLFGQAALQVADVAALPSEPAAVPAETAPEPAVVNAALPELTDPVAQPGSELSEPPAADAASVTAVPADNAPPAKAPPREPAAIKGFSDPLEGVNRIFFSITQPIDRFIIRPAAMAYKTAVPKPARDGIRNALSNLGEPIVFVNDLLQLRPDRAIRTLGRFLVNTLIGAGGLFDIAKRKPFNIAHHPNSLGNTLGYYGVGPLVYIYLPVLGPTTLRDYAGGFGDGEYHGRLVDRILRPNRDRNRPSGQTDTSQLGTAITVLDGLDRRAENDAELKALKVDSVDFYAAFRSSFLQDRAGEIASLKAKGDGNAPPPIDFDDPLEDPEATVPAASPEPAPGALERK